MSFIHLKHVYKHLLVRYIILTHVYYSFLSSFPIIPSAKPAFTREIKNKSVPPSNLMPPWLVDGRSPCFFFPRRTEQAQDQSRNANSSPLGVEVHFLISVFQTRSEFPAYAERTKNVRTYCSNMNTVVDFSLS